MLALIFSAIAILLICGKWILFIFVSPVIIIYSSYKKKTVQTADLQVEEIVSSLSIKQMVKREISRYLIGYIWSSNIQVGLIPSHFIRKLLYKYVFGVYLAPKCTLYHGCEMRGAYNLSIGRGSIVGDHATLDARRGGILIGENVQIGSYVRFWTGSHDHDDPYFRSKPGKRGPIKIENRAWIGPSVTILHSVTIGEGAVVCAGAVVTKDVAPFDIVGGVPAKKIGSRSRDLRYEFDGINYPFY